MVLCGSGVPGTYEKGGVAVMGTERNLSGLVYAVLAAGVPTLGFVVGAARSALKKPPPRATRCEGVFWGYLLASGIAMLLLAGYLIGAAMDGKQLYLR